ncbi:PREDICTED: odorant receptor 43a-like [Acromyrmex echinatior]|uniref:odorant receptor 43a-like n=1 Tax=Acromyrmex echinatior TaxID=103372 RepID=UPI000580CCB0|nr:PREDICTED: odorant receptor 43a-like [Acromyrmex echinatior]
MVDMEKYFKQKWYGSEEDIRRYNTIDLILGGVTIRFADNIESTYSLMMLVLILADGKIDKTVIIQGYFSVLLLIIFLMNTFLYCGAGELVTEQCNAVYRAICDLEWYKLESRKARSLILLMMRAKYPFCITAGKIFPLTMATFCSILKTSMGYISFLLTQHG